MKTIKKLFFIFPLILLTACSNPSIFSTEKGLNTISTLEKIDHHPAYTMTFDGDYNLDEALSTGMVTDKEIREHFEHVFLSEIGSTGETTREGKACTGFSVTSDNGDHFLCHNEDWDKSSYLILSTAPSDGYASTSICGVLYYGQGGNQGGDGNQEGLLLTPFYPLAAMNSEGLAISTYSVAFCKPPKEDDKSDIIWPVAIRMLLDKAATIEEALQLLDAYNIIIEDGNGMQFFIADAKGGSVIVEWINGKLVPVVKEGQWQGVTNFIQFDAPDKDFEACDRYAKLKNSLSDGSYDVTSDSCMALLKETSRASGGTGTQFSVVFNQTSAELDIVFGRAYDNVHHIKLAQE